MELNVKNLKRILAELPDDVILADLDYGNHEFYPFRQIKRLLVLKQKKSGKTYLTINRQGSHFYDKGNAKKYGLEYTGTYFDRNSEILK